MKYVMLLLSVVFCSCNEPTSHKVTERKPNASLVPDSIYQSFFSDILKSEITDCEQIVDRGLWFSLSKSDSLDIIGMDSLFTDNDIDYIFKQLASASDFKLTARMFPDKKIISSDTLSTLRKDGAIYFWENYRKKIGGEGFCFISKPLFSVNRKTLVVQIGYYCGGLCGGGDTSIYKWTGKKWLKVKELMTWVI